VDEAADVADLDAEALGDGGDVDEVGCRLRVGHGLAPGVSVVSFHPPAKRVSATKCDKQPGESPQPSGSCDGHVLALSAIRRYCPTID
jgi:hypothetical protein